MSKYAIVGSCLACLAIGYLSASVGFDPVNPFKPQRDRPVARLLAKVAKLGLWVAVFAEPAPRPVSQQYAAAHRGLPENCVCHAEGW